MAGECLHIQTFYIPCHGCCNKCRLHGKAGGEIEVAGRAELAISLRQAIETTGKPIAESTLHLPFLLHLNQPTLDNHSLVHSTSAEVSPITSHRNTEPRRLAQDGL